MEINNKVLAQLAPTFEVFTFELKPGAKKVVESGKSTKAPMQYEPIILGGGYEWDESKNAYVMGEQEIYYFSMGNTFVWVWKHFLFRSFNNADSLKKWIYGNEKYPDGKGNAFILKYTELAGSDPETEPEAEPEAVPSSVGTGTGERPSTQPEIGPPKLDAQSILNRFKKVHNIKIDNYLQGLRVSPDEVIDLYKQARALKNSGDEEGYGKVMKVVKGLNLLQEGKITKSNLARLIREIVKGIIKVKEQTTTAAVSPVTTPMAFKKKTEEEQIDEMTTTNSGTPGYNIPGWVSRKGGSKKGVEGSAALGYELTPIGKKEMERPGDKLI
jgi:hypothetical protein